MKIGILGGGQLGRMLALAGYPLGLEFVFFDPADEACAAHLGTHIQAQYSDRTALREFAGTVHVATTEFENVPADALRTISEHVPFFPPVDAVSTAQDRLLEKQLFQRLGIATAAFTAIDSLDGLRAFAGQGSCFVKTRRWGYDGKGQYRLETGDDAAGAWDRLGNVPLIGERRVDFEREVSIIAVRNRAGDEAFYSLSENLHRGGVLAVCRSRPGDPMQRQAEEYAHRLLSALDYVGVLVIEFFQCDDRLLANEIAPRVHNTGHWTIEGAVTSQFENHLRAISSLPLGSTAPRGYSATVNCLGQIPDPGRVLAVPGAHLHDYGKAAYPGRKVGHVTCNAENTGELEQCLAPIRHLCGLTLPST